MTVDKDGRVTGIGGALRASAAYPDQLCMGIAELHKDTLHRRAAPSDEESMAQKRQRQEKKPPEEVCVGRGGGHSAEG